MPFLFQESILKQLLLGLAGLFLLQASPFSHAANAPLKVKAIVVTMFEIGEDEGDKAGEFQMWKERYGLDSRYPFPQSFHDIYSNEDKGVLAIVTGMGTARASSAIMALGLDPAGR